MPPRRAAADPEKKKNDFDAFKESEEWKCIQYIYSKRKEEGHELQKMAVETDDILDDWSEIPNKINKLVELLKVPGRRGKGK